MNLNLKQGLAIALVHFLPQTVFSFPKSSDETIALLLQNNVEVQLAYLDYQIARAEQESSSLDFDYFLTFNPSYQEEFKMPNTTLDKEVYKDTTSGWSVGFKRKFSTGSVGEFVWQELRAAV